MTKRMQLCRLAVRKEDGKAGSCTKGGFHFQTPVMGFYYAFGNGKPKSAATFFMCNKRGK